jgi:hypothetical protein
MENAAQYPICMALFLSISPMVLKNPLTLEQAVYMPGNGRHGIWASARLQTAYSTQGDRNLEDNPRHDGGISLRGDLALIECIAIELSTGSRSQPRSDSRLAQADLATAALRDAAPPGTSTHVRPLASAVRVCGIGILGDSYSDEYQFSSTDRRTARNWVEILSTTRGLDFGRFNASGWGGPRDRGFEYNWACSGATTDDMIAGGQHLGLAAQVARGDVGIVFVLIGGNDFINAMHAPDPAPAVEAALPRALANYRLAIQSIRAADPDVRLVLATVPDIRLLPEFDKPIREGRLPVRLADVCTAAMGRFNAQIRAIAGGDRRIALIDFDLAARLANLMSRDYAVVAGRTLDRIRPGNSPDRFFLADLRHPGTLAQAQLARMFILNVNAQFGAGIEPLRDAEILSLVGEPRASSDGSDP